MEEKLALIRSIFATPLEENAPDDHPAGFPKNTPIQHGKYYGGLYNTRKYMYSEHMIRTLPIEKLEATIRNQIGV